MQTKNKGRKVFKNVNAINQDEIKQLLYVAVLIDELD